MLSDLVFFMSVVDLFHHFTESTSEMMDGWVVIKY